MSSDKISPREQLIRAKQAAGLSRSQAEEVVANQEAHDEQLAAAEKKAKAAKKSDKPKDEPAGEASGS